jgi:class 3 adenylate cyclase
MMINLFRKKRLVSKLDKFTGTGTVLVSKIIDIAKLAHNIDHEDLIRILRRYLDLVVPIIEKHSGIVLRFEGDAVLAFWSPKHTAPSHAQLAFDASRAILDSLPKLISKREDVNYNVDIILGTGDITGDFFGPAKQFQIVGKAMAIADLLSRARKIDHSLIQMSQYTVNLLIHSEDIEQTETIIADGTEDLKIFTYRSAKS